ncbi:MAG TPA: hypothetical protein VJN42_04860 [Candidatus Acidoferrum sp.]|nr:hypothetical protein [Candidatus Acidoferrum sp.]
MNVVRKIATLALPALLLAVLSAADARAQAPVVVAPIVVDTAAPIIVKALKPKPKNTGLVKFEGYVMNANIAQLTVRAKGNDLAIRTFSLSQEMSAKMQKAVDKGGFQYGDKVTVYYDPATSQALKFKGKRSKPL